jgi:hypothetical protein
MIELDDACRALLVVVLATAATSKLGGPRPLHELARSLRAFGLPAALAAPPVAAAVIAGEATSAALLLAAPLPGYLLAVGLVGAFTLAIATALARHRRVVCRCFGATTTPITGAHLLRNAILLAAAIAGVFAHHASRTAARADGWWLAIVIGVILGAAITRWDDLAYLFSGTDRQRPRV